MAEQVIIEFIGDTSKLEEAYNKVNEQVTQSNGLNAASAAAFQKANADAAASFTNVTDGAKQFNDQLRNMSSIIGAGVLKGIINDFNTLGKTQKDSAGAIANSYQAVTDVLKSMGAQAKAFTSMATSQSNAAVAAQLKTQTAAAQQKIKLSADADKEIASASVNFAKQASDEIFALENKNRNNRYNAEIASLQKQAAFELDNNNLTQAQKLAIQRKFQKQEAALKLQQFKADQKAKEEQAVINGALAVATLSASTPPMLGAVPNPAYFIGLATIAASTATSVATIAAQKPPQFAKGTPKGAPDTLTGIKLVGEEGPELIYTRGGERIITAPDTAAILAKYDVPAMPNISPAIAMRANNKQPPLINEDSLAKKIAAEMGKQTKPLLSFDKNGFTAHLVARGSKTTLLNNKYKL